MPSAIDDTKPEPNLATTASVRSNFNIAKSEISALQEALTAEADSRASDDNAEATNRAAADTAEATARAAADTAEATARAAADTAEATARATADALLALIANTIRILANTGCASGIAPTGSVAANGALTLGTPLSTTYSHGIYLYFPANAVFSGSSAGSYWCVMSTQSAGIIYNNLQGNTWPIPPTSPTPIVAAGPGAYTGSTAQITVATYTLPAHTLGIAGELTYRAHFTNKSSAVGKTQRLKLGSTTFFTYPPTTNANTNIIAALRADNSENNQKLWCDGTQTTMYGPTGTQPTRMTENTAIDIACSISLQMASATDYATLESASLSLMPGP